MEEGRGAGLLWWRACVKGVLVAPVLLGGHNEREVARWEGDPASLSSTSGRPRHHRDTGRQAFLCAHSQPYETLTRPTIQFSRRLGGCRGTASVSSTRTARHARPTGHAAARQGPNECVRYARCAAEVLGVPEVGGGAEARNGECGRGTSEERERHSGLK